MTVGGPPGRTARSTELLAWAAEPGARGVRFARAGDAWEEWSYARLAEEVRRTASGLRAAGVVDDDVVVLTEPTGPGFVAGLFAILLAGATPAPVPPPMFGQDAEAHRGRLAHVVRVTAARAVLTSPALVERFRPALAPTPVLDREQVSAAGDPEGPDRPAPALGLLQFTSGSSGLPRGVRIPVTALERNVRSIGRWLRQRPEDPTASWLPMYHDMGLIGCLVTPVVHGTDLWLMSPEQFVRDPVRYLECFGRRGARLSAMPTFGLEHVLRTVRPDRLTGMDFSAWRALIVGAERVGHETLQRFCELLGPHGLDPRCLLPAYGLAEATLAVTGLPLTATWTSVAVDATRTVVGQPVTRAAGPGAVPLVGCGPALDGVEVRILDEDGLAVPEGHVGEIEVTGASVADGYHAGADRGATRFEEGRLLTGDVGFVRGGQLYVIGRIGDSLKLRSRQLFAEDVEAALAACGLPRRRFAVLLGETDTPQAVLVVERPVSPEMLARATPVLRRLTEGAHSVVLTVPGRTISRTTSGKPRRRPLWSAYVAGELTPVTEDTAGAGATIG